MSKLREDNYKLLYDLEKDNKWKLEIEKLGEGMKASIIADPMFKAMFQNNNRLKYSCKFLSYFLEVSYEELLKNIKLVKNEVDMKCLDDKNEKCDYVAEIDDSLISIEINNNQNIWAMERNMEYAHRLFASRVKKESKYKYSKVFQFNVNNFAFKGNDKIIDKYFLQNEDGIRLSDKITIVNIYIPKLREKRYNVGVEGLSEIERFLLTLIEQEVDVALELGKGYKIMEEYVKEAIEVSRSESFGESYDKMYALKEQAMQDGYEEGKEEGKEEGLEQGIKQGIEQGRSEGILASKKDIALSMLKENIDINLISKCTGLTIEEINNL